MLSALGALRLCDVDAWREQLTSALDRSGGDVVEAARQLDVSPRTLERWLRDCPEIERRKPGRPRRKS